MGAKFRFYHPGLVRQVAGEFFDYEETVPVSRIGSIGAQAGIYLLLGADGTIVHMGKAMRRKGVQARLAEHMAIPKRRAATDKVVVFAMNPLIRLKELLAIEGGVADLLRLRGHIPTKRWPRGSGTD